MRRTDEDQAVIDRGKLWLEFQRTEWFKDLNAFLNTQTQTLKESVVTHTLNQSYEQAKAEAQKLKGYEEVIEFIAHDAIDKMRALISEEEAERHYREQIPRHV